MKGPDQVWRIRPLLLGRSCPHSTSLMILVARWNGTSPYTVYLPLTFFHRFVECPRYAADEDTFHLQGTRHDALGSSYPSMYNVPVSLNRVGVPKSDCQNSCGLSCMPIWSLELLSCFKLTYFIYIYNSFFYVLLTVHPNIMIVFFTKLKHKFFVLTFWRLTTTIVVVPHR